jgi:peptide/nickel transport system substrate-binding protein
MPGADLVALRVDRRDRAVLAVGHPHPLGPERDPGGAVADPDRRDGGAGRVDPQHRVAPGGGHPDGAVAGRFAPTGELASTILAPGSLGYRHYDLYPTPGSRGDPAKARALLAEAGYPDGLTLTFVAWGSGSYVDTIKPVRSSLARAGIRLKLKTYKENDLFDKALAIPARRLEHQVGQGIWALDYLGDNARQSIVTQYDSRLDPAVSGNFSEYHNPAVNRLIDRALAEPDPGRRAAMWSQIDQRIMQDAPLVPLLWVNSSFQWASRVHGWVYDPWTIRPDLTAVWLDPPSP